MYVIWNPINDLYWSNDNGWGDIYDADTFDSHERDGFRLPVDGVWVLEGGFDEFNQEESSDE